MNDPDDVNASVAPAAAVPAAAAPATPWSVTVLAGLGLVLFAMAYGSIALSRQTQSVAALWPPNALLMVVFLRMSPDARMERRLLAIFFIALFAANLLGHSAPLTAATLPAVNVLEVIFSVFLVRRYCNGAQCVQRFRPLLRFLLGTGIVIPGGAAVLAAGYLAGAEGASFYDVSRTWLFADGLSAMILVPLGLTLRQSDLGPLFQKDRRREVAAIFCLVTIMAILAFAQSIRPLVFLIHPVLMVAALRLGFPGAAGGIFIMAAIGLPLTALGYGPTTLLEATAAERIVMIQFVLAVMSLSILPVAAFLDERRKAAEELAQARMRAERESQAKSRLMTHVNHEVGNALNAILGFGTLLTSGMAGALSERQGSYVNLIVEGASHLQALVTDIRDIARAEAGAIAVTIKEVDVTELVQSVSLRHTAMAEARGSALILSLPKGGTYTVQADPLRLQQAVSNLISNAIKYGAEKDRVLIAVYPVGAGVRIEVTDHGRGIPQDQHDGLFEPFNRLGAEHSTVGGTGIGLSLAKRLTELQGGTIGFRSETGKGTSFWVDFPEAPQWPQRMSATG